MSRSKTAARFAALIATVALVVGLCTLIPHFRAERWTPVVLNTETMDSASMPVTLLAEDRERCGVYVLDTSTSIAAILALAGIDDAEATPPVVVIVGNCEDTQTAQRVDINHADEWLLQALPGIGHERARAIVEYRESHGKFASIDELGLVPGIGAATFKALAGLVTVSP